MQEKEIIEERIRQQKEQYTEIETGMYLNQEKLLEYPGEALNYLGGGDLYKEMQESWKKTVEEQDALQSERGYTLHEIQGECDGTIFSTVEVRGLADEMIQNRINEHLQEGGEGVH